VSAGEDDQEPAAAMPVSWSGAASVPAAPAGERFPVAQPRFVQGGVLGRGGMGEVQLAWDTVLCREVALKVPVDDRHAALLLEEARLTARLDHPAVVPIYDAGALPDGRRFYAMRVVRGEDLRRLIARSPPGPERLELARVVLAAAQGVAHAHDQGIVHRDLSPRNVRVSRRGEVLVLDWGLAVELPAPRAVGSGTPGFRAPELEVEGEASPRSDVWSLGAILHEALVGPSSAPQAPLPRWVPAALRAVAQHARAEAPAARYADAGHFADDLRRALDGQPVSVRPEDTVERLGRLARRHPRTVAAAVLASLALSLVVAGAAAVTSRSRAQLVEQMASHLEERGEEALRRGLEPEALAAAQEAQALRPSARTRGLLAALGRRAGVSAEIVGDEGCATAAVGAGAVRACVGDGVLWLERPGAARVRLAEVGERELVAEVLPGGGVLVGREGAQHAFELLFFGPSGERLGAAQPPNGGRVSWTPFEGGALAGLADDLVLYDAGGQERARRRPCGPVPLHGAVTAPGHDGRGAPWVVCQGQRLREVFGEREVPVPATLRGPTAAVHVGAGQVLVGTAHGRLGLLSLHTGAVGLTLEGGLGAVRRLRALDEATVLVVGEKGVGLWQTALSAWLHVEHRPAPFNAGVADGRVLLWGERERTRWTLPQSAPLAALAWSEGVSALAVSPDGEWLALGSGEGVVRLASVRTGALTLHGAATTQVVKGLAFSPDGRQLAVASSGPLGLALLPVPTLAPARTVAQSSRGVAFLADDELLTFVWSGVHFRWPCSLEQREVFTLEGDDGAGVRAARAGGRTWLLTEHERLYELTGRSEGREASGARDFALSPEGGTIALLREREVVVRGVDEVGEGWRLPLRERAVALALGPGAQRLAVGYRDGRVEVYAVGDAEPVLAVAPFTQRVGELVFDPNGRWLAASSWDGRARLLALAGSEAAAGNSR
jgi:hypothetical protein